MFEDILGPVEKGEAELTPTPAAVEEVAETALAVETVEEVEEVEEDDLSAKPT